jgi:SAM-dependent methyltransferase
MRRNLLDILACPRCHGRLSCAATSEPDGEIIAGTLDCARCARSFPIVNGIPRFVPAEDYAASFGLQWNRFRLEQIDSDNRTRQSEQRFYSETRWTPEWMKDKWLLEVGCGSGRFLEVASRTPAQVVGVDLSNAVDAARETLALRPNVHLVQASIYELPFRSETFDGCYCIGVIQHTPDPVRSLRVLPSILQPGGPIAVSIYERRPWTRFHGKYLLRPLTRRLDPKLLLWLVRLSMPLLFPLTEVLFRIPKLGRLFRFCIPVANYVEKRDLSWRQRYRWAVLDTFDMLSPAYDQPMTEAEVVAALASAGIGGLKRFDNVGVNVVGEKVAVPSAVEA